MVIAMIFLGAAVGLGLYFLISEGDWRFGLSVTGLIAIPILAIWAVIAGPVSAYNKGTCERITNGYGLDNYDWSIRNGCRIEIPTGQLVPEGSIRITSDGQILVGGD